MNIWFDARFINPENPDGITNFSLGLIRELAKLVPVSALICSNRQQEMLPSAVQCLMVNDPTSPKELVLARSLRGRGISWLVSPMQTTSSIPRDFKLALSLHDMIYYRHRKPPAGFTWRVWVLWWLFHLTYFPQRLLLNRANLVLTVSETSKREIAKAKLTKRPIEVIGNASDLIPTKPTKSRHDSKYLIYMGSFIDYKNVEFLVRAMKTLPGHTLVLLSRISESNRKRLSELAERNSASVEFIDGVTPQEYAHWLGQAQALVSASKDEGFGIPVVEAMSQGLPVVLSDLEIFHEVARDAAFYFDSSKESNFKDHIVKLQDQATWNQQSSRAINQAMNYSWEASAKTLLAALDRLS